MLTVPWARAFPNVKVTSPVPASGILIVATPVSEIPENVATLLPWKHCVPSSKIPADA